MRSVRVERCTRRRWEKKERKNIPECLMAEENAQKKNYIYIFIFIYVVNGIEMYLSSSLCARTLCDAVHVKRRTWTHRNGHPYSSPPDGEIFTDVQIDDSSKWLRNLVTNLRRLLLNYYYYYYSVLWFAAVRRIFRCETLHFAVTRGRRSKQLNLLF